MNCTMARLLCQEDNAFRMSVNNVQGAVSAVETKVDETEGCIKL